jgi:phosphopantothenoylcysteine decarboxylase/phosphopantothenate--cysteine ligase
MFVNRNKERQDSGVAFSGLSVQPAQDRPGAKRVRVLITCGPAFEPIDQVRRLTNFSTGRLGVTLANRWVELGWDVTCLKGEGATCASPLRAQRVEWFSTNQDLAQRIERLARAQRFDAVFHAAALCDYQVERVLNERDQPVGSPKIPSRDGRLTLVLVPALKVLPRLRAWFPQARIVGWKYEVVGTREEALAKAWQQLSEGRTDGCVLNGAAYGEGFALCCPPDSVQPCGDAAALANMLADTFRAS